MAAGAIRTRAIARARTVSRKAAGRHIVFISALLLKLEAALATPEHVVEFFGLIGSKLLPDGVARLAHFLPNVIPNQAIQKLRALLALMDDVQNFFALLRRKLQFFGHPAHKFLPDRSWL